MNRRAFILAGAAAVAVAYTRAGVPGAAARLLDSPPPRRTRAVSAVIAYARAQHGKPYLWGGTGPDAFDCSGLVMQAYAAAGITIPRTSQEQWAAGPRVTTPLAGDLVFFPGADGTWDKPGHVGLVIDPGRHLMIQAYASGTPIGTYTFGVDNRGADIGSQYVVGFTRPWMTTA